MKTTEKDKKRFFGGRMPIRAAVLMTFLIFTAVVVLLLFLTQNVFLEDIYKSIKTADIRKTAASLTRHLTDSDFSERVEKIAEQNEICIVVLRIQNENTAVELASVDVRDDCVLHNTNKQSKFVLFDAARKNGGTLIQRYRYDFERHIFVGVQEDLYDSISDARESIVYTSIVSDTQGNTYLILLDALITPVAATVRTLRVLWIAITLVLLAVSIVLSIVLSRKITHPIEQLNTAASLLAQRKYELTVDGGAYRETAKLAETLRYAAGELSKVDDLCHELIANISHDLRTPLTMIIGYAEAMRDLPGENTPENVQIIIDEAERLTSLVNDVLDLSRFQSGTAALKQEPFALTEAVRRVLSRYNRLVEKEGYRVTFTADSEVTVCSDELRLTQALYNLINNAFTYTGPSKEIRVEQTVCDQWVTIAVSDTGDGIPPEQLPLIWDRYYRASSRRLANNADNTSSTHRRAPLGTGLGLSIVRSVMDALGGKYGVVSQVGVGSTFWIALPVVEWHQEGEDRMLLPEKQ